MATINTQHQPTGDEADAEEEAEGEHDEEEKDEDGDDDDDEDDQDHADVQTPASSSIPGSLPLPPQADSQPIPAPPSIVAPLLPVWSSTAIIPFTGSFPATPSKVSVAASVLPSLNNKLSIEDIQQAPTKADGHTQFSTLSNSSPSKFGIKSTPTDADREHEQKVEGKEHKKRSKNWTRAETLTLIGLRTELAPRFAKAGRKSELWDEIAESMQKGPFSRDAQQCRDKWEKLMAGYKEVRDGIKHKDDNPYYEDLHPLLSGRALKRDREQDVVHDHHSAKTEPLKTTIAMDAVKLPPLPQHQYDFGRNLAIDGHSRQPFKSVLLDSPYLTLASFPIDSHNNHQHTLLKNLAVDVKLRHPSLPDGLPFRSTHTETHYSRSPITNLHCATSAVDDEASGEQSHHQKRRKSSNSLSVTDVHAVQTLLESILAKQQIFFKELLEGIERKEELREQMRREREEKWRAEERAQRVFFAEAMHILTQKLGINNGAVEPSTIGVVAPASGNHMAPISAVVGISGLKKRSKNWKRSEVLQLIKLRGEMEERFLKSTRRAALWGELAEVLSTQDIRRDGKQCREKWDKLMSEYKDVVDGKKQKGDSPYFSELQVALAGGGPDNQSDAKC